MSSPANEADVARVLRRAKQECASRRRIWLGPGLPQRLGGSIGRRLEEPESAELAFVEVVSVSPSGVAKTASTTPSLRCPIIGLSAAEYDGLDALVRAQGEPGTTIRRLICPFAVFDFGPNGLIVREIQQGLTAADVQQKLDTPLWAGPDLKELGTR